MLNHINTKSDLPHKRSETSFSIYVLIYYTNHKRITLGYYDYITQIWFDNNGLPLHGDFVWMYLPVKAIKAYLRNEKKKQEDGDSVIVDVPETPPIKAAYEDDDYDLTF